MNDLRVKALVLDSVSSPITKRVYNMAFNEFMEWFQQAPRPGFTKATVHSGWVSLFLAPVVEKLPLWRVVVGCGDLGKVGHEAH